MWSVKLLFVSVRTQSCIVDLMFTFNTLIRSALSPKRWSRTLKPLIPNYSLRLDIRNMLQTLVSCMALNQVLLYFVHLILLSSVIAVTSTTVCSLSNNKSYGPGSERSSTSLSISVRCVCWGVPTFVHNSCERILCVEKWKKIWI